LQVACTKVLVGRLVLVLGMLEGILEGILVGTLACRLVGTQVGTQEGKAVVLAGIPEHMAVGMLVGIPEGMAVVVLLGTLAWTRTLVVAHKPVGTVAHIQAWYCSSGCWCIQPIVALSCIEEATRHKFPVVFSL